MSSVRPGRLDMGRAEFMRLSNLLVLTEDVHADSLSNLAQVSTRCHSLDACSLA